jgi:hypothetical protein
MSRGRLPFRGIPGEYHRIMNPGGLEVLVASGFGWRLASRDGERWLLPDEASRSNDPATGIVDEVRLVKSALLYADRVEILSIRVFLGAFSMAAEHAHKTGDERRLDELFQMKVAADHGAGHELMLPDRRKERMKLAESWVETRRDWVGGVLKQPGWAELAEVAASGVISIVGLASNQDGITPRAVGIQYIARLLHALSPTSTELPMLDGFSMPVAEIARQHGYFDGLAGSKSEAQLAGSVLGYLPAFPDAPMELLLSARVELRPSLIKFRAAIADLALRIESNPWDAAYQAEVDAAFRREIAPLVREIEELAAERRLGTALRRGVASSAGAAALKSLIAVAAAGVASLSDVAQVAAGIAVAGAELGGDVIKDRRELQKQMQGNKMFWLFDLTRRLE